ncbi:DNA/RNA non-specific endonuclease [Leptolyngbya sp. PCC 6406]|uniref:DNA/RNA non-specific endonuclease n=1 Tax=Leptolyngbya sp. PCC 6406 TaxID=1173264 RepID=UPI0012DC1B6D|nr:DNA/RNA non-specific endonuclease [Leptolyngbya sp. PCC 6406]
MPVKYLWRCLIVLTLLGGSWGLGGCAELLAPLQKTVFEGADGGILLPPCVDDDCNCGDFRDQALAQQVLDAMDGDPFVLDRDGNGVACESLPPVSSGLDPAVPPSDNLHLVLGNPSNAGTSNPNNYLLEREGYALAYNRDRGIANWVSWQLSADWLGRVERQDNFRQDGGLPAGFYQVTPNDYRNSGYDRGHIAPSGDRTVSIPINSATFLMTNILPQAPENNRGVWRELEEFGRDLVYQEDRELYIIAGSYGEKGKLAAGRVTIPSRLWKVIVVLDRPGQGVAGVSATSQIIAIDLPNRDGLSPNWRDYQTSIDRIELATGYDLLSEVPPDIQAVLAAQRSNW